MAASVPADHPLADPRALVGEWTMSRTMRDLAEGTRGCVQGTLTVTPSGRDLDWYERGRFTWEGRTADASRRLRLVPGSAGSADPGAPSDPDGRTPPAHESPRWSMTFDDGRLFHPWRPDTEMIHPCGEDLYRCRVQLRGGPVSAPAARLRITWMVSGPSKHQSIVSMLRRTPLPTH